MLLAAGLCCGAPGTNLPPPPPPPPPPLGRMPHDCRVLRVTDAASNATARIFFTKYNELGYQFTLPVRG